MSIDREILEAQAMEAVPTEDYYELVDQLNEISDEELAEIVARANG